MLSFLLFFTAIFNLASFVNKTNARFKNNDVITVADIPALLQYQRGTNTLVFVTDPAKSLSYRWEATAASSDIDTVTIVPALGGGYWYMNTTEIARLDLRLFCTPADTSYDNSPKIILAQKAARRLRLTIGNRTADTFYCRSKFPFYNNVGWKGDGKTWIIWTKGATVNSQGCSYNEHRSSQSTANPDTIKISGFNFKSLMEAPMTGAPTNEVPVISLANVAGGWIKECTIMDTATVNTVHYLTIDLYAGVKHFKILHNNIWDYHATEKGGALWVRSRADDFMQNPYNEGFTTEDIEIGGNNIIGEGNDEIYTIYATSSKVRNVYSHDNRITSPYDSQSGRTTTVSCFAYTNSGRPNATLDKVHFYRDSVIDAWVTTNLFKVSTVTGDGVEQNVRDVTVEECYIEEKRDNAIGSTASLLSGGRNRSINIQAIRNTLISSGAARVDYGVYNFHLCQDNNISGNIHYAVSSTNRVVNNTIQITGNNIGVNDCDTVTHNVIITGGANIQNGQAYTTYITNNFLKNTRSDGSLSMNVYLRGTIGNGIVTGNIMYSSQPQSYYVYKEGTGTNSIVLNNQAYGSGTPLRISSGAAKFKAVYNNIWKEIDEQNRTTGLIDNYYSLATPLGTRINNPNGGFIVKVADNGNAGDYRNIPDASPEFTTYQTGNYTVNTSNGIAQNILFDLSANATLTLPTPTSTIALYISNMSSFTLTTSQNIYTNDSNWTTALVNRMIKLVYNVSKAKWYITN